MLSHRLVFEKRDSDLCTVINTNKKKMALKRLTYLVSLCVLSTLQGNAQARISSIEGEQKLGINDTTTYIVTGQTNVENYRWLLPKGCYALEGQGSESIRMVSTFLAQNGKLSVERTFTDTTRDTLHTQLTFSRYITGFVNHTINPGGSIEIAGKEVTEADIYYEDKGDEVIAHRVTVMPIEHVAQTKPYLQKATDSSIIINWKTNTPGTPVVIYGRESNNLNIEVTGSTNQLSDEYYWHSVELTDLEPDTRYSYKIKFEDAVDTEEYRFSTMPATGSKTPMRILLMGDHQIKSRSGYEWLMQAAKRKINEKYGSLEESINMIMNVGDQVDVGTLDHYEHVHLLKSELMSPYLPIMTTMGNHETYYDPGMVNYSTHFDYQDLTYQGICSGTDFYYAYQIGRLLFISLSTEHTGTEQKNWVRQVIDAAKEDDNVDFIISVNHRPVQAEQYIGDISSWVRNEILPILNQTPKHIFNFGGHHHLYHRGQTAEWPMYHIINGAASWNQMWGMSSEKDYDDVQKTIDYWAYQILEFDFDTKEMKAECYAIGNDELVLDNILIDSFHRILDTEQPDKPGLEDIPETVTLPYEFKGSTYYSPINEPINTTEFQFSTDENFSQIVVSSIRDVENLYGSTGKPQHIPLDIHEGMDICQLSIPELGLKNGTHYVRVRYRDTNMEWSEWSDTKQFTVTGSVDGDPSMEMLQTIIAPDTEFTISYKFAPIGANAWIGVYRAGEKPGTGEGTATSTVWAYTDGASGELTFKLSETDEYYAVLFKDGGYEEASERIRFYVGPTPTLSTSKTTYEVGENIVVSFENIPNLPGDWIGIYKMGDNIGSDYSASWDYVASYANDGKMTLSKSLPKGYYLVSYLLKGAYFEACERVYFSVGEDISTVWTDKNEYDLDEEIQIYYKDGPGTPKDWVGLFAKGKDVNKDELDAFYYTYGATEGYITVKPGDVPAGEYFCALYINDSYDEVSPRIYFTIKNEASGISTEEETENNIKVYQLPNSSTLCVENANKVYDRLEIFSITGEQKQGNFLREGINNIDISYLAKGSYLIRLKNDKSYMVRKFFVR